MLAPVCDRHYDTDQSDKDLSDEVSPNKFLNGSFIIDDYIEEKEAEREPLLQKYDAIFIIKDYESTNLYL